MKFVVTKPTLIEGLQAVHNVVNPRSTLPILSNVLLDASDGRLAMSATDLELSVRCSVEATIEKAGRTTLPARRLLSIARELPDKEIEIVVDENNAATMSCESSFFKILGLSESDFPPITKPEGKYCYHIGQGAFRDMLRRTAYAVSTDETRYVLNGVLLSFRANKLAVAATDGRRLALVEYELEFPKEAGAEIILPTKAVNELIHTLRDEGDLRIYATGNQAAFEFGDTLVLSKVIEGTYPNFRQVIPSESEQHVPIGRETLLTALKRVSLLTPDQATATKMTFSKNSLEVATSATDIGEARESIPIKYSGRDITVAFNAGFIMDALRNLDEDQVYLEFTDDLSPGVIKCDIPFLYVLMPMRINP